MDHFPPKSYYLPSTGENFLKNQFLTPKYIDLRTFDVKISRVAFTRFWRQIHQSARIGGRGGGGGQANLFNARILRAFCTSTPP